MQSRSNYLPELNHLSLLVSTILLAYTLTNFVTIPTQDFDLSILGVYFPVRINFSSLVAWLVAGLTASGTAWLLQHHPQSHQKPFSTAIHWLLPSFTALVQLRAINLLGFGGVWWIAAMGSGFLLLLVLTAEYIVVDTDNQYYTLAEMGITGLSVVFFLILTTSLHTADTRLFYRVPLLSLAALLVYLRIINLRQPGNWALIPGVISFLIIGEIASVLHYLPMGSVGYGLALTGSLYGLIEMSDALPNTSHGLNPRGLFWPILILVFSWGLAFFL